MKTITISAFKAHLSEELRQIRKGAKLVICDRDIPIAEVLPYRPEQKGTVRVRAPKLGPFTVPQTKIVIKHDPVEYLLEDRKR